ncbi:hypothetical protein ABZ153_19110 [Streptomyces sp. NPDC006290]|uniref:hypothetical protein n=1 Tax=Streptomyces sp. NPDC006290 TaxID=3156745 RepID=UPI0033B7A23D
MAFKAEPEINPRTKIAEVDERTAARGIGAGIFFGAILHNTVVQDFGWSDIVSALPTVAFLTWDVSLFAKGYNRVVAAWNAKIDVERGDA